jgi:uncharacterized lipoprotein YbaY
MRVIALAVLISVSLLAACGKQQPAGNGNDTTGQAAVAVDNGPVITGLVVADKPAALTADATLHVRLLDITKIDAEPLLITEKSFPVTTVPAEFKIPYDTAMINPIRSFAIDATIMAEGQVRYVSTQRQGVLTQGKPATATIPMVEALTHVDKDPAAELNTAFAELERQLGALKRFEDSRVVGPEGKQVAIGGDAFADETGVRMVRQQVVDDAAGTRVSERFAYLNGKPWVAIREAGGTTTKLGWAEDGTLLVKERNGKADEAAAELADSLKKSAQDAYDNASAKVPE